MEQPKARVHLLPKYAPRPENVNAEKQQMPPVMVMEQPKDHVLLAKFVKQTDNVHRWPANGQSIFQSMFWKIKANDTFIELWISL